MTSMRHDGSIDLVENFSKNGIFQYSERVNVRGDEVEISILLQKDYSVMDHQSVKLSRDFACDVARAILKHFNEEL